jgi:hypothetical protein
VRRRHNGVLGIMLAALLDAGRPGQQVLVAGVAVGQTSWTRPEITTDQPSSGRVRMLVMDVKDTLIKAGDNGSVQHRPVRHRTRRRARRRLREHDRPAAQAPQTRQCPLSRPAEDLHVDDLRPPRARGPRAAQSGPPPAALRRPSAMPLQMPGEYHGISLLGRSRRVRPVCGGPDGSASCLRVFGSVVGARLEVYSNVLS